MGWTSIYQQICQGHLVPGFWPIAIWREFTGAWLAHDLLPGGLLGRMASLHRAASGHGLANIAGGAGASEAAPSHGGHGIITNMGDHGSMSMTMAICGTCLATLHRIITYYHHLSPFSIGFRRVGMRGRLMSIRSIYGKFEGTLWHEILGQTRTRWRSKLGSIGTVP